VVVSRQVCAQPQGAGIQHGKALGIYHRAGAWQSLTGGGLKEQESPQGMDAVQTKKPGSWWGVDPERPRRQGSRQGMDLVIPQGPDDQQRLRGVGLIGRCPGVVWIQCSPRGSGPNGAWI
jgi:hypothetical protein